MSQRVTFQTQPTENPDSVVDHARTVVNATSGIGMDELVRIVEEQVPFIDDSQVVTQKDIIFTSRYECPCCNTALWSIVDVSFQGLWSKAWDAMRGLYRISITPDHGKCRVRVERLHRTSVYEGECPYLPQKDYAGDPDVVASLQRRDEFFAQAVRDNPGRVVRVSGIETGEDLARLVEFGLRALRQESDADTVAEQPDAEDGDDRKTPES